MTRLIKVIVSDIIKPQPQKHEVEVAWILARYFNCIVEFLQPSSGYKVKTPDIVMQGIMWEIKSPTGSSKKNTIEYQFKGFKQSRNLIIDGRRTKLKDEFIYRQILHEKDKHGKPGRILLITKENKIVEV